MHTADLQTGLNGPVESGSCHHGGDKIQRRTCDFHVAPWRVGHLSRVSYMETVTKARLCVHRGCFVIRTQECCIKMGGWIGAGRNGRPSPRQLWIELAFTKGVENCFDRFWLKSQRPRVLAWETCNANSMPGRFFHIFHVLFVSFPTEQLACGSCVFHMI